MNSFLIRKCSNYAKEIRRKLIYLYFLEEKILNIILT